jgi:hypothetical protein
MNTRKNDVDQDGMRPEYDLSKLRGATKGKYYASASAGNNLVLIDPDLTSAFPDAKSVNNALRVLVNAAKGQVRQAVPRIGKKTIRSTTSHRSPLKKTRVAKAARG